MSQPHRILQSYGMDRAHKLGSTLRVDVIDMLGHGMIGALQSIHSNNVEFSRSNPSVVIEFRPKESENRFEAFVVEIIEAVSKLGRTISVLKPKADPFFSRSTDAGSNGVLRPKGDRFDSFFSKGTAASSQATQAGSTMERSISALRLWAHANWIPGTENPAGKPRLGDLSFTVEDVRRRRAMFASLKPYFSRHPATRFEFRGCGVANLEGLDLMKELAQLWGIRVHAGELSQPDMTWVGRVVEALPDGTLRETAGLPFDSAY